jgi:hypothetical protein
VPAISLVVCVYREQEMLQRLLRESAGLFDDLVIIHDGPEEISPNSGDPPMQPLAIDYSELSVNSRAPECYHEPTRPRDGSIHELAIHHGGRFFEGPRCFQQEPHWPFAWSQARHDWILRLDADEFPSVELKEWLRGFGESNSIDPNISGYTCIWPLWNGEREVMSQWPIGRNFLFHRGRVRFFGMVEQVPIPDRRWEPLNLRLCHQPQRKSYGLANILSRRQGYLWRWVISQSLLKEPKDLPRWRWQDADWPAIWRRLREQSLMAGIYFLLRDTGATLKAQWRAERRLMPLMALATPLHHFLINLQLCRKRRFHSQAIAR